MSNLEQFRLALIIPVSFRPSYERKLDVKDYDTDGDISSLYVSMYKRDYYIHQVGVQDVILPPIRVMIDS